GAPGPSPSGVVGKPGHGPRTCSISMACRGPTPFRPPAPTAAGKPCGPGAGRHPPDLGDCAGISALYGVGDILAGRGAGYAGPGRDGPGTAPSGHGGHLGHGTDAVATAPPGPAGRGSRVRWPGRGGATPAGRGPGG